MSAFSRFNLMSWNVTGLSSSSSYLADGLTKFSVDFCGLCEHWLYDKDLHFLCKINSAYSSFAVSDSSLRVDCARKVGKGGVAIMWKRQYDNIVSRLPITSERIIGIQVELSPSYFVYIIQSYLPSKNHTREKFAEYIETSYYAALKKQY